VIIYLATFPRSGNDLLQMTIRRSFERMTSQIAGKTWSVENFQSALDAAGAGWTIADFAPENAEDEVTSERLARYRWLEGAWRRFLLPSPIDQFTPELRQALAAEEEIYFFKTHHRPFASFFAGERVIQVVRHPGAAIWSLFRMVVDQHLPAAGAKLFLKPAPTLTRIIERDELFGNWSEYHQAWAGAAESLGQAFLALRFEDFIREHRGTVQTLSDFIELPVASFEPPPFEGYRSRWPGMDLRGVSEGYEPNFTAGQLELLWELHGAVAAALGYDPPDLLTAVDGAHERRLEQVIAAAWRRGEELERTQVGEGAEPSPAPGDSAPAPEWFVNEHAGRQMKFRTPNELALIRAKSVLTKERGTIAWIDSFAPGEVFWDVGANVGAYSIYAGVYRDCEVLAFEPAAQNYWLLNQNIAANGLEGKVRAFCIALGWYDNVAVLNMQDPGFATSMHAFDQPIDQAGKPFAPTFRQGCLALSGETLVQIGMPKPDHIKIDVDGYERQVVRGLREEILDHCKSVLVELDANDRAEVAEIRQTMRRFQLHEDTQVPGNWERPLGSVMVYNMIFRRA
jgi:FkbM family methyltransferase